MADVHDKATRSRNMAAIKGKNTKPEVLLRKALFSRGFRFRLHRSDLPGKPDITLPKYNAVIFVHGCFWHGHQGCPMFKVPSSRTEFWLDKISSNQQRDARNIQVLKQQGWRVLEVWECAIKGKLKLDPEYLNTRVAGWVKSDSDYLTIRGTRN